MKRMISAVIALLLVTVLPMTATAANIGEGSAVVAAENAAQDTFDTFILYQMEGRAGAATGTGAKGIAFEAIMKIKYNVLHLFDGTKAIFSPSSTDPEADLLIIDKAKSVIKKIQCKDGISASQLNKTIDRIRNGQYSESELVGTTEFAEIYNAKAVSQGSAKLAVDSGISTETTNRIANKAIRSLPSRAELVNTTLKMSGYAAAFTCLISTAESIIKGDDLPTAVGNITTDTAVSGLSFAVVPLAKAEFTSLLTDLGCSVATTSAATTVIGFLLPLATGMVLYLVVDELDLQDKIADCAAEVGVTASELYIEVQEYFQQLNCLEKAEAFYHSLAETYSESKSSVTANFKNAATFVSDQADYLKETVSSIYSKIF